MKVIFFSDVQSRMRYGACVALLSSTGVRNNEAHDVLLNLRFVERIFLHHKMLLKAMRFRKQNVFSGTESIKFDMLCKHSIRVLCIWKSVEAFADIDNIVFFVCAAVQLVAT